MGVAVVRGERGRIGRGARVASLAVMISVLSTALAYGQSIPAFVAGTSRSANAAILAILLGNDTTDAVAAARALGERKDAYVGDILSTLFSRITGSASYRLTLLLRIVLEYDFLLPSPRPARIAVNEAELTALLGELQSIPDAETKGALLEISRYLPAGAAEKPLLDESGYLMGYLRANGGRFAPDRRDESLSFIGACRAHSNPVLRSQVAMLVELSRDETFVRAAQLYLARTR